MPFNADFQTDLGNTSATTGELSVGYYVTGQVGPTGADTDWYRITLAAGQAYVFDLEGVDLADTTLGRVGDSYLRLYDASGTQVGANDDSGGNMNSRLTYTPTAGGSYYLSAESYGHYGTGEYRLTARTQAQFDATYAALPQGAPNITLNGSGQSVNEGGAFVYSFTRSGDLSGTSSVAWALVPASTSGVAVADFAGGVLPSGTVSFAPGASVQTLTIATVADVVTEGTESFSLVLSSPVNASLAATQGSVDQVLDVVVAGAEPGGNAATAGSLAVGQYVTGGIAPTGSDTDWYRIALTAGTTYVFELDGVDLVETADMVRLPDAYLRLFDAGGTQVGYNDDGGGNMNSRLYYTPSASGSYYLSAESFGHYSTGDYKLTARTQAGYDAGTPATPAGGTVVTVVNTAPTLTGLTGASFAESTVNAAAQVIDADVIFADSDGGDLSGGVLTVAWTGGGSAQDQLGIQSAGQIGVSGSTVSYGGSAIGTIATAGANGASLVVNLTGASATPAAVDALIQALTYRNTSDTPTASRTLSITVSDGDGGTSVAQTATIGVNSQNDAPSGAVSIAGSVIQGQALSVANSLADAEGLGTIAYQWQTSADGFGNWVNLGGATTGTLTLAEAQVGQHVRVVASYTDGQGTAENVFSSASAAVTNLNDAPVGAVTVAGTPTQGQTLTASASLTDADGLGSIGYQWQASSGGGSWSNLSTGPTLTLASAQVGQLIRAVANYSDGHGTTESVASGATAAVAAFVSTSSIPEVGNTAATAGTLAVGQYVSGEIAPDNGDTDWYRISLAAGEAYVFDLEGIDLPETAAGRVADSYLRLHDGSGTQVAYNDDGGGNMNSRLYYTPTASGSYYLSAESYAHAYTGDYRLTARTGAQFNAGYAATPAGSGGSAANGAPTLAGLAGPSFAENTVNAASQIIDGDVSFTDSDSVDLNGGTLTAAWTGGSAEDQLGIQNQGNGAGQIGVSGNTVSYGGSAIGSIATAGANGASLVVNFTSAAATPAAVDALIQALGYRNSSDTPAASRTLSITVSDGDGGTSVAQTATIAVTSQNDAPTGAVTIAGSPTQGQTLSASNSLADADGLGAVSYQWQTSGDGSNWSPLAGGDTLTLGTAQVGLSIRVLASYSDGRGTAESVASTPTAAVATVAAGGTTNDHGGNAATAGSLAVGQYATGEIGPTGADTDWYRITLTAGQAYVFELDGVDLAETPAGRLPDAYLRLYNSGSTQVASNDDSGGNMNSRLTYTPSAGGTYYLAAESYGHYSTGDYKLTARTQTQFDTGFVAQPAAGGSGGTVANAVPTLGGFVGATVAENAVNAAAQIIDAEVVFGDIDSADLNGGTLTAAWSGGGAEDQLAIQNQGVGTGQIGVSGSTVRYGGNTIGTLTSDGANGADLVVTFTSAAATPAAVDALIQALTYRNTSHTPAASRSLSITVADGDGGTGVTQTATIAVTSQNDAPTGSVSIAGSATQGQTLSASNSVADADGLGAISYQWQASSNGTNWSNLSNGEALTLGAAQVSQMIRVVASYSDAYGTSESVTSPATAAVVPMASGGSSAYAEPAGSALTESTLAVGQYATGEIGTTGADTDWYRIALTAGQAYVFDLEGVDLAETAAGRLGDAYLRLYDAGGTQVGYNDDGGGNMNSRLSYTPTAGGSYYLSAESYGHYGTGDYRLSARTQAAFDAGNAALPPVSPNVIFSGAGQAVSEGGSFIYDFTRSGDASATSSVAWTLVPAAGDGVAAADFAGGLLPAGTVTFAPGVTRQTITIVTVADATSENSEAFGITLSNAVNASLIGPERMADQILDVASTAAVADGDVGDSAAAAGALAVGQYAIGAIGPTGADNDWYRITLTAGQAYVFELDGVDDAETAAARLPDAYLRLYDAGGAQVAYNDDGGGNMNSRIGYTPTAGGNYYLSAESFGHYSTGDYRLTARTQAQVTAGTSATVATGGGVSVPDLQIVAASATQTEGGAFVYTVSRSGDLSGASTVAWNVETAATAAGTAAADFGAGTAATLPSGTISFAAGASVQTLTLASFNDTEAEDNEAFAVRLSNPVNANLAPGRDVAQGAIADDNDAATTTDVGSTPLTAATLAAGQYVTGQIGDAGGASPGNDNDWYRITLSAGQQYVFDLEGVDLPGTAAGRLGDAYLRLYDAAGTNQLAANDDSGGNMNSRIFHTPTSGGVFYLSAESYGHYGSGEYKLTARTIEQYNGAQAATPAGAPLVSPDVTLSGAGQAVSEGGVFVYSLARSGELASASTVAWSVVPAGGSGITAADFVAAGGTVSFAAGETVQTLTIASATDEATEGSEAFSVVLSNPVNATLPSGQNASDQLLDVVVAATDAGDIGSGTATVGTLAVGQYATGEIGPNGADTDWYGVTLNAGQAYVFDLEGVDLEETAAGRLGDAYLRLYDAGGTQVGYNDDGGGNMNSRLFYTPTATGTFFLSAESYGHYGTGDYRLTARTQGQFDAGAAAAPASGASGTVRLPEIQIVAASFSQTEGGAFVYTVSRSGDLSAAAAVNWAVSAPQAAAGSASAADFGGVSLPGGTVSFAAGASAQTLTVTTYDDTEAEGNEAFSVQLFNPLNASLAQGHDAVQGMIADNADFVATTDVGATAAAAATLAIGQFATGQIGDDGGTAPGADNDWYRISLNAGQEYVFDLEGVDLAGTAAGRLPDAYLRLYDAAGTNQLAYNDDGGGNMNSRLFYTPTATGTFYLSAESYGHYGTGEYKLSARTRAQYDDTGFQAEAFQGGGALQIARPDLRIVSTGQPQVEGGTFVYTVSRSGDLGDATTVDWAVSSADALGSARAGDFSSVPNAQLPSGTISFNAGQSAQTITLATVDDSAAEGNEDFSVVLANAANGNIVQGMTQGVVQDNDQAATAADDAGNNNLTNASLAVGQYATGQIGTNSDSDWYRITLAAGASYVFDLEGVDLAGTALGRLGDTYLRLYDNAGTQLAYDDDGGGNLNSRLTFTATAAGTYYLAAESYGHYSAGEYRLTARSQSDFNDNIAASPAGGGAAAISRPDMRIVTTDYSQAEGRSFVYTVSRSGDLSGSSRVDWAVVVGDGSASAAAADFGSGAAPSGTLTFAAGQDSQTITIATLDDAMVESSEAFAVSIANPTNANIVQGVANNVIQDNDQRVVAVGDDWGDDAGTNGSLEVGRYVTGQINPTSDVDWFRIGLSAGQAYVFDLEGVAMTGSALGRLPDAYLRLYDSAGSQLAYNDDGGGNMNSRLRFTAQASGTYYLAAESYAHAYSGDYKLTARTQAQFDGGDAGDPMGGGAAAATNLPAQITVAAVGASRDEGSDAAGTPFTFAVTRSGNVSGVSTVAWALSVPATELAASADDFVGGLPGGTLTFAAAATAAVITVMVAADSGQEQDEGFSVRLTSASSGTSIRGAEAAGLIVNDDLGSDDYLATVSTTGRLNEGGSGVTGVIERRGDEDWFKVTLTAGTSYSFDLSGQALGGGAGDVRAQGVADTWLDLYDATGHLLASDDDSGEGLNSSLRFTPATSGNYFASARGYGGYYTGGYRLRMLGDGQYTSDARFEFAQLDTRLYEGNSGPAPVVFTVRRSGDTGAASAVNWGYAAPTYGDTVSAADFAGGELPTGGTLNFAAGQTEQAVTISINGDALFGGDSDDAAATEYFSIELSDPVGGTVVAGRGAATAAVMNDDDAETGGIAASVGGQGYGAFQPGDDGDTVSLRNLAAATPYLVAVLSSGSSPTLTTTASGVSIAAVAGATGAGYDVYRVTATASGDVALALTPGDATIGVSQPYAVSVTREADDDFGGAANTLGRLMPSRAGGFVAGVLNGAADQDWFQVALEAGQDYSFLMLGNTDSAYLELRDAGGNPVGRGMAGDSANSFLDPANRLTNLVHYDYRADSAGVYYAAVRGGRDAATPYALMVNTSGGAASGGDVAQFGVVAQNAYVVEGDRGQTPFVFAVQRDGDTSQSATATWSMVVPAATAGGPVYAGLADVALAGGTALPGGTVNFGVGATAAYFTVMVKGDVDREADELLAVDLTSATNGVISGRYGRALGLIRQESGENTSPMRTINVTAGAMQGAAFVPGAAEFARAEGDAGATPTQFVFRIARSGAPTAGSAAEVVNWAVSGSGAVPASAGDFAMLRTATVAGQTVTTPVALTALPAGRVTFTASQTELYVTVTAMPDVQVEGDEAFRVRLSLPANAARDLRLDTDAAFARIANDDDLAAGAGFAIRAAMAAANTANEDPSDDIPQSLADRAEDGSAAATPGSYGATPFVFRVLRGAAAADTAVSWAVQAVAGGAAATDFVAGRLPSGTLTFLAGETAMDLTVVVAADADVEADEAFAVQLTQAWTAGSGGTLVRNTAVGAIAQGSAAGLIRNDDNATPDVSIAALNSVRLEGNAATTPFTFLLTRRGNLRNPSTVAWRMDAQSDGEPTSADFASGLTGGTVSFAANAATAVLTVAVRGDGDEEGDEAFAISLTGGSNANIVANRADGIVLNDDHVTAYADHAGNAMNAAAPDLAPLDMGTLTSNNLYGYNDYLWSVTDAGGAEITAGDTEDWYAFHLDNLANLRTLRLSFVDPDGIEAADELAGTPAQNPPDLDLTLYDEQGRRIAEAASTLSTVARGGTATTTLTAAQGGFVVNWNASAASTVVGSASLSATELADGTYYLRVGGFRENAEARYALQLQADVLPDTAGNAIGGSRPARRIALDGANVVTIHEPLTHGDQDYYTFTTTAPTAFQAGLAGMQGNVDLRLLDAGGNVIAAAADSGTSTERIAYGADDAPGDSSSLRSTALAAGTYYLWAYSPEGAATAYDLSLAAAPYFEDGPSWDSFADANAAQANAQWAPRSSGSWTAALMRPTLGTAPLRQSGTVNGVDQVDYWAINLSAASSVAIAMARVGNGGNADLQLLDSSGNVMATGVEGANGAEQLNVAALADGNYVVRVAQYAGATRYNLAMTATGLTRPDAVGESVAAARNLNTLAGTTQYVSESIGFARPGTAATVDNADWYKFTAGPAGGTLTAVVSGLAADARVRLLAAANLEQIQVTGMDEQTREANLTSPTALTPGATYIVSIDNAAAPSDYNLALSLAATDNGADTLAAAAAGGASDMGRIGIIRPSSATSVGTTTQVVSVGDFIGVDDAQDYWRFRTDRLSNLRIDLAGLAGDADIVLLDAAGSEIARSALTGNRAERIGMDNLAAGTYYVSVARYDGAIQDTSYTLSVDAQAPADNAANTSAAARRITLTPQPQSFSDWVGTVAYADSANPFTLAVGATGPTGAERNAIVGRLAADATTAASDIDRYDWYRFALAARSVVTADVDNTAATLDFFNGNGSTPATDADPNSPGYTLAQGDYFLRVDRGTNSDVSYTLTAASRLAAPADRGGEIATPNTTAFARLAAGGAAASAVERLGLAQNASATRPDHGDAYVFVVPAGETWQVTATLTGLEDDASLALYDADEQATPLQSSNRGGTADEALSIARLAAGTYHVRVADTAAAQDPALETAYTLSLTAATADDRPDGAEEWVGWGDVDAGTPGVQLSELATPAQQDQASAAGGRIETADDVDWFRVAGLEADVSYVIRQRGTGGNGALADSRIGGIYDAAGQRIANSGNDDAGGTLDAAVAFTPAVSGDYYIAATAANGNTGRYTLSITRQNLAPVVTNQIVTQVATEGQPFTLRLPWNVFADPENAAFTIQATQAAARPAGGAAYSLGTVYGRALPDWLSYDAAAQVFVGTPPAGSDDLTVRLIARDRGIDGVAGNADDNFGYCDFALRTPVVADDFGAAEPAAGTAPVGALAVGGASHGVIDAAYDVDWFQVELVADEQYTVTARGTASGGGTLADPIIRGIYRASGGTASLLPDSSNNDMPGSSDASVDISVAASGTYFVAAAATGELRGSYTVGIAARSRNVAPVVNDQDGQQEGVQGIADIAVRESQVLRLEVPSGLFTDADADDRLTFSATRDDGSPLPAWLNFNAATRIFSGTVPANVLDVGVRVTARDGNGMVAADEFVIRTDTAQTARPGSGGSQAAPALPNWTVMVYMAADNNLEQYALKDVNEMEAALRHNAAGLANVNVVIQLDRIGGYSNADGNWTDTRRGRLTADHNTNAIGSTLTSIGERNMGDPTTLTDFVNWAAGTYRAEHYALVLWDHGGGLAGTCWDDTNGQANLSVVETTQALATSTLGRVDVMGFDTCLQGMVEQAYDLRVGSGATTQTLADYVVAAEDKEPGDGWDYTRWLKTFNANSDARSVAVGAVQAYGRAYEDDQILAAVQTSALDALVDSISSFVEASTGDNALTSAERAALRSVRTTAQPMKDTEGYRDLGGFMDGVAASAAINANLRARAAEVSQALSAAVLTHTDVTGMSGLSIFAPGSRQASAAADYNGGSFRFVADSRWNEFLTAMNG